MSPALPQRRARIALVCAILFSLPLSLVLLKQRNDCDIQVYLTAAHLVRENKSIDIYSEADGGLTPQALYARAGSKFLLTAQKHGIPNVLIYLYPPLLADAFLPLTYLPFRTACNLWLGINVLALAGVAAFLFRAVNKSPRSFAYLGMVALLLAFRPVLIGLVVGQVTAILLLLWTAGIVLFLKGYSRMSAITFAIAAAIKLTPLLVVVPFLFWREWKWIRVFLVTLCAIVLSLCWINGPATLADYALHVVPPFSHGIPMLGEASLATSFEVLCLGLAGADVTAGILSVPHWLAALARLLSYSVALGLFWEIYKLGPRTTREHQARVLAVVALLSVCVAPVSWRHAYGVAFLLLALLWKEACERGTGNSALALLTFCTVELGFVLDHVVLHYTRGVAVAIVQMLPPLCAVALMFHALRSLQGTPSDDAEARAFVEGPAKKQLCPLTPER
jgi:hypothetical protein